ncbi:uncharacterized protein LOC119770107 isoform X2 [Culex quinquefasciatus]|uniref:uncharacterized protein LOC119770107 isoform X2 n=1 Tax=Culex quinquefasciatus TaxID=7176 RepID=UPI0018E2B595|nr:uncharacterized protein LOC119770107 isoform X2 [Culex quinquefasciatus]
MGSNGLATSIEMFRKCTSFTDWSDRLAYTFHANQVAADRQKSHFMMICGPFLFSQLKLHYSKDELDKATYADIVSKLKQKLDKTEPDLVQRFRFSQRNQQPDESNEDFVQAVKMQAEFCGFGAFKNVAIMDRVLAGLLDGNLKENLLKEESLTLDKMDKFITTWNIAKQNVKALNNQPGESQLGQYSYFTPEQIHYIQKTTTQRQGSSRYGNYRQNDGLQGQNFPERRNNSRFQPYKNYNSDSQVYTNRRFNNQTQQQRYFDKSYDRRYPQTRISCDFCGKMGHSKQNCFKLDYFNRQFVNFMGESTADDYSCNEGGEIEYANAEMFNQIENFQDNNDQCMKIFTVLNTTYVKLDETQIEDQMVDFEVDVSCLLNDSTFSIPIDDDSYADIELKSLFTPNWEDDSILDLNDLFDKTCYNIDENCDDALNWDENLFCGFGFLHDENMEGGECENVGFNELLADVSVSFEGAPNWEENVVCGLNNLFLYDDVLDMKQDVMLENNVGSIEHNFDTKRNISSNAIAANLYYTSNWEDSDNFDNCESSDKKLLIGNDGCGIECCIDDVQNLILTPIWGMFQESSESVCFGKVLFDEVSEMSERKGSSLSLTLCKSNLKNEHDMQDIELMIIFLIMITVIFCQNGFKAIQISLFLYKLMTDILTSIANLQFILILSKGCAKKLDNRFVDNFCGRHDQKFVDDCWLLNDKVGKTLFFQSGKLKCLQVIYAKSLNLFLKSHICYTIEKQQMLNRNLFKSIKPKLLVCLLESNRLLDSLAIVIVLFIFLSLVFSICLLRNLIRGLTKVTNGEFHNFSVLVICSNLCIYFIQDDDGLSWKFSLISNNYVCNGTLNEKQIINKLNYSIPKTKTFQEKCLTDDQIVDVETQWFQWIFFERVVNEVVSLTWDMPSIYFHNIDQNILIPCSVCISSQSKIHNSDELLVVSRSIGFVHRLICWISVLSFRVVFTVFIINVLKQFYLYFKQILVQHGSQWSEDKKTRWRLVARIVVLWTRRRCAVRGDWQSKKLLVECSKRNDLLLKTKCETTWRFRTRTRVVLDAAETVRLGMSLNGKEQNVKNVKGILLTVKLSEMKTFLQFLNTNFFRIRTKR